MGYTHTHTSISYVCIYIFTYIYIFVYENCHSLMNFYSTCEYFRTLFSFLLPLQNDPENPVKLTLHIVRAEMGKY